MSEETKQYQLYVEPPKEILKPLELPVKTLTGPGPSNCSDRVLRALQHQTIGHLHPEICQLMDEIKAGLQYIFQTKNRLTLAVSATGHGGMEACLGNLVEPGETVLIPRAALWSERVADMVDRIGGHVAYLETNSITGFTLEQLKTALEKYRPAAVFVVHGETCSGRKQPLAGVADLIHKYNALLIVDTVASLGGEPFFMDAWGVDAVYTGTQKSLAAPSGLAPLSLGARAEYVIDILRSFLQVAVLSVGISASWTYASKLSTVNGYDGNFMTCPSHPHPVRKKLFSRRTRIPVFYWDLTILGDYWACFGRPRVYHHTISATLVYGLREALSLLCEEGLVAAWARHAAAAARLRKGLELRGLHFYVKNPEYRLSTVVAIELPPGVDGKLVSQRAMDKYKVEISQGLGPTAGKVLRIGVMGINATEHNVDLVLTALDEGLKYALEAKL